MLQQILHAIGTRVGTSLGSALAAYGVAASDITVLVAAIPVLLGIMLDVVTNGAVKRRAEKAE